MADADPLLDGQPIRPEHRARLGPFLAAWPQALAGYSWGALSAWAEVFDYRWAFVDPDCLFLTCDPGRTGQRHLLQPLGRLSPATGERLAATARHLPYRLRVVGVSRAFLEAEPAFAALFEITEDRDQAQYMYRASDLAGLPGRHFSGKRNLLAQAARLGWTAEPLLSAHATLCQTVVETAWQGLMTADRPSIDQEAHAIGWALDHFGDSGQEGVLVRLGGQGVAFSIFEPQNADTAVVHFERALREPRGLYQVVNRETARVLAARGFRWINREEDLGDPGLRQAKMSYHPAFLEPYHVLAFRS
jgi:uncharacterized protein